MKKYYAFYQITDGGEKFYFENGEECAIVVKAESEEEAKNRFLSCVDYAFEEEASAQIVEELPDKTYEYPFIYYVEWDSDSHPIESEMKKARSC